MPRLSTAARSTDGEGHAGQPHPARRAALIATAVTLPIVVILALALARTNDSSDGPVSINRPPDNAACATLMDSLPDNLLGLQRRETKPADDQVRAWGDPAIVLRCGVDRPAGLEPASDATVFYIKGQGTGAGASVLWLPDPNEAGSDSPTVLTAVDREIYVEATLPRGQDIVPWPQISDLIAAAFPNPVCLGQTTGGGPVIPDAQLCTHRP